MSMRPEQLSEEMGDEEYERMMEDRIARLEGMDR
jgi:hypothetical protein